MSNWENAPVICRLKRSDTPLTSRVPCDEATALVEKCFDYKFTGETRFYPFVVPESLLKQDVNIIQIVGPSGSGKSTFLKAFEQAGWHMPKKTYDCSKALISNFASPKDGVDRLNAVGLRSMPVWCKPRDVLSTGQGFRADLALNLDSNVMIDEYTSVVNRECAISTSVSVQRYIRERNLKNVIFCGCHYDIIPWLKPDILIDVNTGNVYDLRGVVMDERLDLSIEPVPSAQKRLMWSIFAPHHYLDKKLNAAADCWVLKLKDAYVGFCAVLPHPSGTSNFCKHIHRVVVLPDFQGMGLGSKFMEDISQKYLSRGYKVYLRTACESFGRHCAKSPLWRPTGRNGKKGAISTGKINGKNQNMYIVNSERYSYEYVGADYATKPHAEIVVDDLADTDVKTMRRFLVELKQRNYITVVHGGVRWNSRLNNLCQELGIRTELLYLNNHGRVQLNGKHRGKDLLVSFNKNGQPKYKKVA